MKTSQKPAGKITEHSRGLGTVTKAMVEKRAKELATINGRPGNVTEGDRQTAEEELQGGEQAVAPEISDPEAERVKPWDEARGSGGRHIRNLGPEDEQRTLERLVQEGVDEAEHDRMVAATKPKRTKGSKPG